MRHILSILLLAATSLAAYAQIQEVDPEIAREILEAIDKKHASYKAMKVDFTLTIDNKQSNSKTDHIGRLEVMDKNYHLSILGNETYCNGKDIYTYSKENNEVTVTSVDEEQVNMSPIQLLSAWKEGYKLRYLGDADIDGYFCTEIDLYPVERTSPIVRIRVTLEKKNKAIRKILQQTKDGMLMTYAINGIEPANNISEDTFTFNESKFPGVEIIDMR